MSGRRRYVAYPTKIEGTRLVIPKGSRPLTAQEIDEKLKQQKALDLQTQKQKQEQILQQSNPFLNPHGFEEFFKTTGVKTGRTKQTIPHQHVHSESQPEAEVHPVHPSTEESPLGGVSS
jgi:hypothetical protein